MVKRWKRAELLNINAHGKRQLHDRRRLDHDAIGQIQQNRAERRKLEALGSFSRLRDTAKETDANG